jgi:hypothetical protein
MTSQPDPKDGPPDVLSFIRGYLAAALRVVPPEGADNAVHLTVAWNAFSRAWPYETTPTLRDALFVAVEAALESAALRASGAGTRQGEPPEPITKDHLDVAMKAADADYQQTAGWPMDAEHSDDLRRRRAMFAALTSVWDALHAESRPNE